MVISMERPTIAPTIPESITVHLGPPDSNAANVTVSFMDYLKNVASSEIYPTWQPSALRANILAIASFALNRVFTEHYRSRGYNFDITSSTATDQKFINGRNFFDNIDTLVDDLFDDYIRRDGYIEPLSAKFCNGTTTTCDGLSQWGSEALAKDGYNSVEILKSYYGDDIELVVNAPISDKIPSYPGTPIRVGSTGPYVTRVQIMTNRVAQAYPSIPKINPVDGIFGTRTEQSVKAFQKIFNLTQDGIVGKRTWYRLVQLYTGLMRLSELDSEGVRFEGISWEYPDAIVRGDSGAKVTHLQYMLAVLADFYNNIPPVSITGVFGEETYNAVIAFQKLVGEEENGIVGAKTWDLIYSYFIGVEGVVFDDAALFPFQRSLPQESENVGALQDALRRLKQFGTDIPPVRRTGMLDRQTTQALARYQRQNGLAPTGRPNAEIYRQLQNDLQSYRYKDTARMMQFPGFDLRLGVQDEVQSREV